MTKAPADSPTATMRSGSATKSVDSPGSVMIDVESVSKRFGDTQALDEISLSISSGQVLALLVPTVRARRR